MDIKTLIPTWFRVWESGEFQKIPVTDTFIHISPFGTIEGKKSYLELVVSNKDKFLDYRFEIHDTIYDKDKACVRYTAHQGEDFKLDVSEWYYISGGLIDKIVAYYHIGEIREDRKLKEVPQ